MTKLLDNLLGVLYNYRMDFEPIKNIIDSLSNIGDFLCNTPAGVGILVGSFIIITLIAAALLERKTSREFSSDFEPEEELAEDASLNDNKSNTENIVPETNKKIQNEKGSIE